MDANLQEGNAPLAVLAQVVERGIFVCRGRGCKSPDRLFMGKYIPNDYCPHCGAKRLLVDDVQSYIDARKRRWLVCDLCHHGFSDTVSGRWTIKKFQGTNFSRSKPIPELLNPNEKQAYLKRQKP